MLVVRNIFNLYNNSKVHVFSSSSFSSQKIITTEEKVMAIKHGKNDETVSPLIRGSHFYEKSLAIWCVQRE